MVLLEKEYSMIPDGIKVHASFAIVACEKCVDKREKAGWIVDTIDRKIFAECSTIGCEENR